MVQEVHTTYRVVKAYEGSSGDSLVVREGERLAFERRETEFEGWIWCVNKLGEAGWVPEAWVALEGRFCVMRRDCDSTELTVEVGEELTGAFVESGWMWARKSDGQEGWVPLECVEMIERGSDG